MKPDTFICRYNIINFLSLLEIPTAKVYAEITRRRSKGLILTKSGMAIGIKQSVDRHGRVI